MFAAIQITSSNILLVGAVLILVAIFAVKGGSRFSMPTLILFLLVGMLFGSDGIGIEFDSPETVQFVGMMALSVILFTGGMETSYKDIAPVAVAGIVLSTLGVLLTALVTGAFIFYASSWFGLGLTFLESLLLASLFSSTDSASVFSILRAKRQGLKQNLKPLLELESGSNDPMAYMLTIMLISVIGSGATISTWDAILILGRELAVGALAGYIFGKLTVLIVNRIKLTNNSLYSTLLLAMLFLAFGVSEVVEGNEYLAVYIMGLVVGNNRLVYKRTMTTFFDGLTWLFQIVMFVMLGLLVNPLDMVSIIWFGIAISVFVILFARPLSVFVSLSPFRKITKRAKVFISWVGLRGAVPIIFATYPLVADIPHSKLMFNVVFLITIVSLLVQGTTVGWVAKKLRLATKEREMDNMGFDIPDNIKAALIEVMVDENMLRDGDHLRDMPIDEDRLVMMVERGGEHIVPRGNMRLKCGDKLLIISTNASDLPEENRRRAYRKKNAKLKMKNAK